MLLLIAEIADPGLMGLVLFLMIVGSAVGGVLGLITGLVAIGMPRYRGRSPGTVVGVRVLVGALIGAGLVLAYGVVLAFRHGWNAPLYK